MSRRTVGAIQKQDSVSTSQNWYQPQVELEDVLGWLNDGLAVVVAARLRRRLLDDDLLGHCFTR